MNPTIIYCLIILTLVALAHAIHTDYDESLDSRYQSGINNKDIGTNVEPLVISDSDYSTCRVGCIIACTNKHGILQKECYPPCVHQCWNY